MTRQRILQTHPFTTRFAEAPLTLIDVGARDGLHPRWRATQGSLRVIAFEPDEVACRALQTDSLGTRSSRTTYLPVALSNSTGQGQLYVTRAEGCSSLLEPNFLLLQRFPEFSRYDIQNTRIVPTDRLDHVLESLQCEADFIKLDVQGSELRVLQGAEQTLTYTTFGVEVEVEFVELYKDQPLFAEVDTYLRKLGFMLFDMKRYWWKRRHGKDLANDRGQLVFGDALYLKDYIGQHEHFNGQDCIRQDIHILKAIAICVVYEKFDYALELSHWARGIGVLGEEQAVEIEGLLRSQRRTLVWLPPIRGRYRLAKWLMRLASLVSPKSWGPSDLLW